MTFIPTHAQQLVIIQWMDSCIPKEEEDVQFVSSITQGKFSLSHFTTYMP
jgi:hypothetical protein